jgi:predicted dinucleotide-binding enzyme
MKIAVLGSGNIGGTLGKKWAAAGHEVTFGVRNEKSSKAKPLPEGTSAASIPNAIRAGDIVVFAVPYGAVAQIVRDNASILAGKVVIDATNNFGAAVVNNLAVFTQRVPNAHAYRAFNSMGWENFADPVFGGEQADLFYCGPEGSSRSQIERLIADIGLKPIYVGGLDTAPFVDAIGSLWVALAYSRGMGRRLGFKTLTD